MSSPTPRDHVTPYLWEIGEGARTAIIGHNNQWHVLEAVDTFRTLTEATHRLNEIEANFDRGKTDVPQHLLDLIAAADRALPFVRAVAPAAIVSNLEQAVDKARPK